MAASLPIWAWLRFADGNDSIHLIQERVVQVVEGTNQAITQLQGPLLDTDPNGIVVEVIQLFPLAVPLDNGKGQ